MDPLERLFFSPSSTIELSKVNNEFDSEFSAQRTKYTAKLATKSNEEARLHRRELDLRQPEYKKAKLGEESKDQPCLHHVGGYCNHKPCLYAHQMRLPKTMNVCKFYLTESCTKGNACNFMHGEFPCKYFYLGIPHPKNVNEASCRFHHGDVLNANVRQALLRSIEFWIREKHGNSLEKFEQEYSEMCKRLNDQETVLKERNIPLDQAKDDSKNDAVNDDANNDLQQILTKNQCKRLADNELTSIEQMKDLPMSTLEEYGLSINQIYEIKMKIKNSEKPVIQPQTEQQEENKLQEEDILLSKPDEEPKSFFYTDTLSTVNSSSEDEVRNDHEEG